MVSFGEQKLAQGGDLYRELKRGMIERLGVQQEKQWRGTIHTNGENSEPLFGSEKRCAEEIITPLLKTLQVKQVLSNVQLEAYNLSLFSSHFRVYTAEASSIAT